MELIQFQGDKSNLIVGFAESRIGGRNENQDSYGFAQTGHGVVMIVCDGMGGGPGGKIASDIAVNGIISSIVNADDDKDIPSLLKDAFQCANRAIINAADNNTVYLGDSSSTLHGMGSTATALFITEEAAYAAHVGDSRIYQIRGRNKIFRTFDHSLVFDLVKQNVITEEQARLSAQSNIITRALGIHQEVTVDIAILPFEKGDRFMLCTDGIHGVLPEKSLIKMVANKQQSLGAIVDDIATLADNIGHSSGGSHDNLTIAIVETNVDSKIKSMMSKKTKRLILLLLVLCVVSIFINLSFFMKGHVDDNSILADSAKIWAKRDSIKSDSIVHLNDSIMNLQNIISGKNN